MNEFTHIEQSALDALKDPDSYSEIALRNNADSFQELLAQLSDSLALHTPVTVSVVRDGNACDYYSCSTPIGRQIIAVAAHVVDSTSSTQKEIVEYQCRRILTFPEKLSNAVAEHGCPAFLFDALLYWERLIDTVLLLLLPRPHNSSHCEGVPVRAQQLYRVLSPLVVSLVRRGNVDLMARRLALLPKQVFDGDSFAAQLSQLFCAVLEGCTIKRFSLKTHQTAEVSRAWSQWVAQVLLLIERRPEVKKPISKALAQLLSPPCVDATQELARNLFDTIFLQLLTQRAMQRASVRLAFKELLPAAVGVAQESEVLTAKERTFFKALFTQWDNKTLVSTGDMELNLSLLNPVMYALLYIHEKGVAESGFPNEFIGALLNGVTLRLDSTRGAKLQGCATTVAAAFATLFVKNADGVPPLLKDGNFSDALHEWMREEPEVLPYSSLPNEPARTLHSEKVAAAMNPRPRFFSSVERYPLDPDEVYHFFSVPHQVERTVPVAKNSVDLHALVTSLNSRNLALPPFGQQNFTKDELDDRVEILSSIRECYNALVGIGRNPNAQLNEVQEATESSLRGLSDAFAKVRKQATSEVFKKVHCEIGPLLPTLLPTLISLNIHAPEERKLYLLHLRYNILVDVIVLNPVISLSQLSGMIYKGTYGIYQRNELIKAMGEAAAVLSSVDVTATASPRNDGEHGRGVAAPAGKKVYPPIPTHELSGSRKTAIVVTEGQRTRRWGNAVLDRHQRQGPKRYTNLLGEHAASFVAAFLFKLDADHFAFFQESDPYTPCAILDALTAVFQGITNVRHIATDLCEKNFDFFFTVCTRHPNITVRKAAWAATAEVMRAWCGVAPLWIRRKDGERILNRDAKANPSLMFTKSWLSALEMLQHACDKLVQSNDACTRTALIAVSTLRDLVCDRDDFHSMLARVEDQVLAN